MKKYDGKHRKRTSRRKRNIMRWRNFRAAARGVTVKEMFERIDRSRDPLLHSRKINT